MASNKRKNYYAIAGMNGYGTYNNYDKVLATHPYVKKYKCKGAATWEEAKELAFQMFQDIRGPITVDKVLEPIVSMNWFYRIDA